MSSSKNLEVKKTAFLNKSNSAFIEEMYKKFVNNDPSLPDSWKNYFDERFMYFGYTGFPTSFAIASHPGNLKDLMVTRGI